MFTRFKQLTWKASLLATIVNMVGFTIAFAASGDLDTTLDGDGMVTTDFGVPGRFDNAQDVALQADGKIVAAGYSNKRSLSDEDFALTRYNPNGSLDTTFSGDGRLVTNFGGVERAWAIAVQSDGKIVVTGSTCNPTTQLCDLALARYNTNGTLDTTFSGDGKQITDFGGGSNGTLGGLVIQADGKILVAGYMGTATDFNFAVYRYLSNGSLDPSFSGDGKASFGFGSGRQDAATALAIQPDGKIVVAGYSGDMNGENHNFAIARLNANGSLDATFSGDGRQGTDFGGDDFAYGLALQPDGKMVIVGQKFDFTNDKYPSAIARYNSDGTLDDTFGQLLASGKRSGKRVYGILPGAFSFAADVAVQLDGKIVVAGATDAGGLFNFALVRLNGDSSFDTTFSGDGKVTVDFGSDERAFALALQPSDGKYVLGGVTYLDGTQSDFALARVLP
jgi:uncharacterized delta-60 repeat protein